jgi:hypothetical protein
MILLLPSCAREKCLRIIGSCIKAHRIPNEFITLGNKQPNKYEIFFVRVIEGIDQFYFHMI